MAHMSYITTLLLLQQKQCVFKMGFDTFTSKELMNITEYTPSGSWPTDKVLVNETVKAMDATENQSDFVYDHSWFPMEIIQLKRLLRIKEITVTEAPMKLPIISGILCKHDPQHR